VAGQKLELPVLLDMHQEDADYLGVELVPLQRSSSPQAMTCGRPGVGAVCVMAS